MTRPRLRFNAVALNPCRWESVERAELTHETRRAELPDPNRHSGSVLGDPGRERESQTS